MKIKLPRMYLSGFRAVLKEHKNRNYEFELDWIKRSGTKYRCLNFAYVCPGAFYYQEKIREMYDAAIAKNVGIFMDSSAFSFYQFVRKQGGKLSANKKILTEQEFEEQKNKTVKQYIDFVKSDSKHWDVYCNFDYKKDCDIIWDMQKYLEKKGIRPAPVYHGDMSLDFFKRYCDEGYKLICIGAYPAKRRGFLPKRKFFEKIFRIAEEYKVNCHGFAFTYISSMLEFPWWSVDSATWAKTAAFGMILVPDNDRSVMRSIHVSERQTGNPVTYNRMPKSIRREIEDSVDKAGFDFDKLRTSIFERCVYNAWIYNHLDQFIDLTYKKANWEILV
jgi:hypothetical protein